MKKYIFLIGACLSFSLLASSAGFFVKNVNLNETKALGELDVFSVEDSFDVVPNEGSTRLGQFGYWVADWEGTTATPSYSDQDRTYTVDYHIGNTSNWWSMQLFGKMPNPVAGDTYKLSLTLTSTVTGKFNVNGTAVDLVADTPNDLAEITVIGTNTLISIQAGVDGVGPVYGPSANGRLTVKVNYVHDVTEPAYTYHKATFMVGESIIRENYYKAGSTFFAPKDPTSDPGSVFEGWYDGDNKWTSSTTLTSDSVYTARFSSNTHTVSFYNGASKLGEAIIADGGLVSKPSQYAYSPAFGMSFDKWFADDGLTSSYDFSTPVTANLDLYGLACVAPTELYVNGGTLTGYSVDNDGAWNLNNYSWVKGTNWHVQVNFARDFATYMTDPEKNYTLSFDYKASSDGAFVNVYHSSDSRTALSASATFKHMEITIPGSYSMTKVSFELGSMDGPISFSLANMSLEEFADKPVTAVFLDDASVGEGSTKQLTWSLTGNQYSSISFESSNTSYVTVTNAGAVTGVSEGHSATITISVESTNGNTYEDTCTVTVVAPRILKIYYAVKNGFTNLTIGESKGFGIYFYGSVNSGFELTSTGKQVYVNSTLCDLYSLEINLDTYSDFVIGLTYQLCGYPNTAPRWGNASTLSANDFANNIYLTNQKWDAGNGNNVSLGAVSDLEAAIAYYDTNVDRSGANHSICSVVSDKDTLGNFLDGYDALSSNVKTIVNTFYEVAGAEDVYKNTFGETIAYLTNYYNTVFGDSGVHALSKTSEQNNASIFIVIAIISLVAVAGVVVISRKRKTE